MTCYVCRTQELTIYISRGCLLSSVISTYTSGVAAQSIVISSCIDLTVQACICFRSQPFNMKIIEIQGSARTLWFGLEQYAALKQLREVSYIFTHNRHIAVPINWCRIKWNYLYVVSIQAAQKTEMCFHAHVCMTYGLLLTRIITLRTSQLRTIFSMLNDEPDEICHALSHMFPLKFKSILENAAPFEKYVSHPWLQNITSRQKILFSERLFNSLQKKTER